MMDEQLHATDAAAHSDAKDLSRRTFLMNVGIALNAPKRRGLI